MIRRFLFVAYLAMHSSIIHAELITGHVVDIFGNGVQGVDIDVENEGSGGDPSIFNDGTDATGFFSTTVSDFGVFNIEFNAPPPGATTVLSIQLDNVLVVGTVDLGTIVLPPGVALSGRVVDAGGFPVANVNLDIFDENGSRLVTPFDRTDLFGNFIVGVPATPIEVGYDARPVLFPLLASQRIGYSPTSNLDVGDVVLPPGILVSGSVATTFSAPVVNADLDFSDAATGERAYTPGDNTDDFGNFSVTVPTGVYDIQVCPMPADLLVSKEVDGLPLTININLGTLLLEPGFLLSGTLTNASGTPVGGVDIDIEDSITGATIALCDDDTNAMGFYSVLVPIGTYDITFTKRCGSSSLRRRRLTNVNVTGNQTLNSSLPPGPCTPVRRGPPGPNLPSRTVL